MGKKIISPTEFPLSQLIKPALSEIMAMKEEKIRQRCHTQSGGVIFDLNTFSVLGS